MRERARATARTRERILRSGVALFAEVPYPQLTLALVAQRAGVSVQTVIRHFRDKEGLIAACARSVEDQVREQRGQAPVGDPAGAVANLVEHYEVYGPVALRLVAEEETSPSLAELAELGRTVHREWCRRVFEPFLPAEGEERTRRLAQLVTICDVHTWKLLRDNGLDPDATRTALLEMIEPLTTGRA
jgi:AcrR family transcriptional regulator